MASVIGQTLAVSEPISLSNDKAVFVIGKMRNHALLIQQQNDKAIVKAFDDNMLMRWEKELVLDKRDPNVLLTFQASKDYFCLLYLHQRRQHTILKIHRYSPAAELIDSITIADLGLRYTSVYVKHKFSEDKKKLLIMAYDENDTYDTFMFDTENMQTLWQKSTTINDEEGHLNINEQVTTNVGEAYFIEGQPYKENKKNYYQLKIDAVHAIGDSLHTQAFEMLFEEQIIKSIKFVYDNLNKQLLAVGTYAKRGEEKAIGYCYLKIPKINSDATIHTQTLFDEAFVAALTGKKTEVNEGIRDLQVQRTIIRRDGGILALVEVVDIQSRQYQGTQTTSMLPYARAATDYKFNDIVAISINADGSEHYKTIMPKAQYSANDEGDFCSFGVLKTPGNIRLLYNDVIEEHTNINEYNLNSDGEFTRRSILNTGGKKVYLNLKDAIQVGAQEFILWGAYRNKFKLARIQL